MMVGPRVASAVVETETVGQHAGRVGTLAASPVEPATDDDNRAPGPGDRPVPLRWAVAAALTVGCLRLLYSAHVSSFRLTPDELANGGMARFLAGGRFNLFRIATWQPGMPTLLAPIYWVVDDPTTQIRAALVVNAALAGVGCLLLVRITERLTPLRGWSVLGTVAVVGLLPASMSASAHVWAEPLVTVCVLTNLLVVVRYWERPTSTAASFVIVSALAGYLAHTRLLPLLVTGMSIVAVCEWRHRNWARLAGAAILAVGGYVVCSAYADWVFDRVWEEPSSARSVGEVASRLTLPTSVLDSAIGQMWYLLATTALLFGFGAVELVRRAFRRSVPASERLVVDARLLLLTTVPLIALSIVYMADRRRTDYFIYGRYNDAVIWPILAVGLGWLLHTQRSERRRTRLVIVGVLGALLVELGLVVHQLHGHQLALGIGTIDMVAGVTAFSGWQSKVEIVPVTIMFGLVAVGLVLLALSNRWRLGVALVAILIVTAVGSLNSYRTFYPVGETHYWAGATELEENIPVSVAVTDPIRVGVMPDAMGPSESQLVQVTYGLLYQWYSPDRTFVLDTPTPTAGDLVVAVDNDVIRRRNGATIIWSHPESHMALWCDPIDPANASC